jgi:predicted ABC-type ATPase
VLRYLDKEGYQLSPETTLLSYAERIGHKINFNTISFNTITFLDVARIFMRVRYGEKDVKEDELRLVMQFCKELEKHLELKLGKRKMFFDRFVFLHFNQ